MNTSSMLAMVLVACVVAGPSRAVEDPGAAVRNDYPTAARAEYVFGCMAANGQTPEMLQKCACSIDVIAEMLPYKDYQRAETVLAVRQDTGVRGSMFRESAWAAKVVAKLKQAQAESTLRCF